MSGSFISFSHLDHILTHFLPPPYTLLEQQEEWSFLVVCPSLLIITEAVSRKIYLQIYSEPLICAWKKKEYFLITYLNWVKPTVIPSKFQQGNQCFQQEGGTTCLQNETSLGDKHATLTANEKCHNIIMLFMYHWDAINLSLNYHSIFG